MQLQTLGNRVNEQTIELEQMQVAVETLNYNTENGSYEILNRFT